MSLEKLTNGNGAPDAAQWCAADAAQLRLLDNKRVIIGLCDGNRMAFFVHKEFCARLTDRDVKKLAGMLETTLKAVAAQVGNVLR